MLDFILIEFEQRNLCEIKGDIRLCDQATWIGLQDAFGRFQQIRHDKTRAAIQPEFKFCGEVGNSKHFFDTFREDLFAFSELVSSNQTGVGGYPIPFVVTNDRNSFGNYALIYAGAAPQYNNPDWRPIDWAIGDAGVGSHSIMFSGSTSGYIIKVD